MRAAILLGGVGTLGAPAAALADGSTSTADAALLDGVRAFRADRYGDALAAFERARRAGAADLAIYLGPTLYKLGRFEEARAVLARRRDAGERDEVADYYLGLTYRRLGFVRLARALFATLDAAEAGPRLADGARRFVMELEGRGEQVGVELARADALAEAEPERALDHAREALLGAPEGTVAHERAARQVLRLAIAIGAAPLALELLRDERTPSVEVELARAALRAGDRRRARSLLDDARRRGDADTRAAADRVER